MRPSVYRSLNRLTLIILCLFPPPLIVDATSINPSPLAIYMLRAFNSLYHSISEEIVIILNLLP